MSFDGLKIKNVFVIGAGFMGSGIVENVATKGLPVAVYDVNVLSLMKSEANIKKRLDNQVFREKISEEEGVECTIGKNNTKAFFPRGSFLF